MWTMVLSLQKKLHLPTTKIHR